MNNFIDEISNNILVGMYEQLNKEQLSKLKFLLYSTFDNYDVSKKQTNLVEYDKNDWEQILQLFCAFKKIENKKDSTLSQYSYTLRKLFEDLNKPIAEITTNDLRLYMVKMVKDSVHGVSQTTLENIRHIFTSFFGWCVNEGIMVQNPSIKLEKIKIDHKVKTIFNDEEQELLRINCKDKREIAIVDFLYSTGMRVSEMLRLNISDINWNNGEVVVLGKGNKERVVVINGRALARLKDYINNRKGNNEALFCSNIKPFNRLSIASVELILRKLGDRANVSNVHPHAYRTKFATDLLRKGCPIADIAEMMGHSKIETTKIYTVVSKNQVIQNFNKYA